MGLFLFLCLVATFKKGLQPLDWWGRVCVCGGGGGGGGGVTFVGGAYCIRVLTTLKSVGFTLSQPILQSKSPPFSACMVYLTPFLVPYYYFVPSLSRRASRSVCY